MKLRSLKVNEYTVKFYVYEQGFYNFLTVNMLSPELQSLIKLITDNFENVCFDKHYAPELCHFTIYMFDEVMFRSISIREKEY